MRLRRYIALLTICITTLTAEGKGITREQRDSLFSQKIESMIVARQWIFHPVTIENVELGSVHEVYTNKLFLRLDKNRATVHLPMEFTRMVIYTEDIASPIDNYSAVAISQELRRVAFTVKYDDDVWVVEVLISTRTSETIVAITTIDGTMRYLGSISAINKTPS